MRVKCLVYRNYVCDLSIDVIQADVRPDLTHCVALVGGGGGDEECKECRPRFKLGSSA